MKQSILIFCCVLLFIGCNTTEKKSKEPTTDLEKLTYFKDLEGNTIDISDYKGKKVLVNFWATWCGPCKKEMPDLLEAQEILKDENYVFLLVSDESVEKISAFKSASEYDFTFLKSTKSMANQGIYALPTTFVYSEDGKLSEKITGMVLWSSEEMLEKLKSI